MANRMGFRGAALTMVLLLTACSATDGELMLSDGTTAAFAYGDYRGQHLLINYWAEWCAPCRHEIPELNSLAQDDNIAVLGVNFDGDVGAELAALLQTMRIEFPTLLQDPASRFAQQTPMALPTTFVIEPTGALKAVLVGPQTRADAACGDC